MSLSLHTARFLTSAAEITQLPPDIGSEVAFAGRSNAGKSTAINCLTQQKQLAKASKTPGRTQLINFFSLDETHRLVDLPGYGFAKVPKAIKENWQQTMGRYLETRESLAGLILLMDIRHPLKPDDCDMLDWARASALPTLILLTKADKLSRNQQMQTLAEVKKHPLAFGAMIQTFSAMTGLGVKETQKAIQSLLQNGQVFSL